jgi:hypothetical protein
MKRFLSSPVLFVLCAASFSTAAYAQSSGVPPSAAAPAAKKLNCLIQYIPTTSQYPSAFEMSGIGPDVEHIENDIFGPMFVLDWSMENPEYNVVKTFTSKDFKGVIRAGISTYKGFQNGVDTGTQGIEIVLEHGPNLRKRDKYSKSICDVSLHGGRKTCGLSGPESAAHGLSTIYFDCYFGN